MAEDYHHHKDDNMDMVVKNSHRKGYIFPWRVTFTIGVAGSIAFSITRVMQ